MIVKVLKCLLRAGALSLCLAGSALAQTDYPNRPVRVVVPFAPGGPSGVLARIIMAEFSKNLGKQFYVENHAGAGANLGIGLAARAAPDGYTVLLSSSSLWLNPSTYSRIPYDPQKDFIPISLVATTPNALVVHPSVPVQTVKELVDLVRASPGKYTLAIPGVGTPPHLSGELFRQAMNLDMTSVSFNGGGPMIQSVVAGHTPIGVTSMPPAAPQIIGGRIRALAITAPKRNGAIPDVPTMAEAGFPGQEGDTPQGLLVPAGTPQPIVDILYRELMRVLALADVRQKLAAVGMEVVGNSPAEFTALIRDDGAKWAKVIRAANIKVE